MGRVIGRNRPIEQGDHWVLPIDGSRVTRWAAQEKAFNLELDLGLGESARVFIEGQASVTASGSTDVIDGWNGRAERTAPFLALLDERVAEARAWKDGRLEIRFADGGSFTALPREDGEAWSVRWRDREEPKTWIFSSRGRALRMEFWLMR